MADGARRSGATGVDERMSVDKGSFHSSYQRRRGTPPLPTRPVQVAIGERRRPQPFGQPGWVRVDTVHQGDLDGIKGLYHVNLVDEGSPSSSASARSSISTPPAWPRSSTLCCGRSPSPSTASTPTTARSSSTARSRRCSRGYTSTHSPSPAPVAAPTTPWSRARTARSSASSSVTATSPAAVPRRSTPSPSRSSRPISTSTAPASSPPKKSTARAACASATATPTS